MIQFLDDTVMVPGILFKASCMLGKHYTSDLQDQSASPSPNLMKVTFL